MGFDSPLTEMSGFMPSLFTIGVCFCFSSIGCVINEKLELTCGYLICRKLERANVNRSHRGLLLLLDTCSISHSISARH